MIVEQQNAFGGVATNSTVNVCHSLWDTQSERKIIAGRTLETLERLNKRDAVQVVERSAGIGSQFNSEELKIEWDEMIREAG